MLTRLSTEPFTKDTLCIMASLAKLVTTIAILQCVEKSLIALDDPVEQILLELADPDILEGFSDEGKPILRKANEKITLRYARWASFNAVFFNLHLFFQNASQPLERSFILGK
jgi:hypothetical protein